MVGIPTPFSDPGIWQHGTFTFTAQSDPQTIDSRGNVASTGEEIAVTFKLTPSGGSNLSKGEAADTSDPSYDCKVVAVNGDYGNPILPSNIRPGDIGDGVLNGRQCRVTIKNVAQSSTSPITEGILGSTVVVDIHYRVRRGSRT